jgi:hypothetical protein
MPQPLEIAARWRPPPKGLNMTIYRYLDANRRKLPRLATAMLLGMSVVVLGACQTPQERITQHEDNLAAAGFVVKPANTPERQAMLKRLPANHFVKRVHEDIVHYVYSDPLVCGCLYVGSQQAYDQYKRDQMERHLADEQQMTADTYSDAAWNWNAWGPWGPGYGFGYGYGAGIGW